MSGVTGDNPYRASGVVAALAEGRTGTVDWDTTPKTGTVTAESAVGYFINTTSGGITVNLPAGAAGSIVAIADYTRTFNTNNCTVTPNGSEKMGGGDAGGSVTLSVNGQSATFVYVDGTEGWINVQETESSKAGPVSLYVTATGGAATLTVGDFKTHVFTGPGTLCVSCAGNACGSTTVDYLVSAGGGGGGGGSGGAGGAGGFRLSNSVGCIAAPVMSPLANPTGITVSATGYPIVVGGGGAAGSGTSLPGSRGVQGATSSFSTISSAGGGYGGGGVPPGGGGEPGGAGGSGGGGRGGPGPTSGYPGGAGDTPDVTPDQGFAGGAGYDAHSASTNGGGGGGAAAVGANSAYKTGGAGGAGSYLGDGFFGPTAPSYGEAGPVSSTRYFSGGGGGATDSGLPGASGGAGGVGGGGDGNEGGSGCGCAGVTNTGGGAGSGSGAPSSGGVGGPGIVTIRYKFQ